MKLIVGLGNFGREYNNTRHNIGFEVIDKLSFDNNIKIEKKKFKGLLGEGVIGGEKCLLVKPQTYMNLSGDCVKQVIDFYKIDINDIIVIYDDIALDVGKIRVRKKGSSGGQKGIQNIIGMLGTDEIQRVRIGVGEKPPKMNLSDYVLSRFLKEEEENLIKGITLGTSAIEDFISMDIEKVMTKYN
ncbi:MAG: aminoacyl-tRNA hydrolase [Lachnospirales bacterium]